MVLLMLLEIKHYVPPNPGLWKGRKDSLPGERFFQQVNCIDVRHTAFNKKNHPVILGFCSDEGIRRNEGRVGATAGPDVIREQLGKLASHSNTPLFDIGNIVCKDDQLEAAQDQFSQLIGYCHQQGLRTMALGGGHEIAWPHFHGLMSHYPKVGIINFDAHFDLRPVLNNKGTSGTPFWQIKQYCEEINVPFDYCCLGIQPLANTKSLFQTALNSHVSYLTVEQMNEQNFRQHTAFLENFMRRHEYIYLTLCLDVFAECFAPGVSAPQATGLTPWQVMPLLQYILQTGKVVSLDIAEFSPPLDEAQKTARLAAILLGYLLNLN